MSIPSSPRATAFITLLVVVVATLLPSRSVRAQVTPAECQRHRDAFIAGLEANRRKSVREIDDAWRETRNPREREHLEHQRNEAWEHEERMRSTGDQIYRDCMAHAAARGTSG